MFNLFFINIIVVYSSYLLTLHFNIKERADFFCAWFLLFLTQIIVSLEALGILSLLNFKNVFILNLAILLFIFLLKKKESGDLFRLFNFKNLRLTRLEIFLFSIILSFGLTKILINLMNPPFGHDSLNYHFTFAVEWLKNNNLITPITIADDPSPSFYPINGSLFYLWLILPLKNVFIADLGQLPFFIFTFIVVYSIGKKISLDTKHSLVAALLFTLIPNYFKQIEIAYVDVMVAMFFLFAVNFLFLLKKDFSLKNIALFSLSLGFLVGTKTIGLTFSFLLIIPFFYFCLRNLKRIYLIFPFVFFVIISGGFSYLNNYILTGNPLYPLSYKLFGYHIFPGVKEIPAYRTHTVEDYKLSKALFHEGLGAQTILFGIPGILFGIFSFLRSKQKKEPFLIYFFLIPILLYLMYRYMVPLANVRYLYSLMALGIIMGVYLYLQIGINKKLFGGFIFICAFSSMFQLAERQELGISLILTFVVYLILYFSIRKKSFNFELNFIKIITLLFIFAFSLNLLEKWYTKNEFSRYTLMRKYSGLWEDATKAWEWLNKNTAGANIAYVGRPVPFPLYGSNFKNNVYYVSVNKIDPPRLYDFPKGNYVWKQSFLEMHENFKGPGNYRSCANYYDWLNNLFKRGIDYLFIYSLHQAEALKFPIEDDWAKGHPRKFKPVFTNQTIHIYKIVK